ncbi:MAG: filamentous hemagglutinin N-terminal domain-containing protein, partial [Deltaproteobacteria bacterium]|nr:filamentous hemagglutinin N-terminal domain-containing protein [Deltaproteobacteria bacterium]
MNRKYYPVWGKIKRIWVTVTDMAASGWFSRPLVAMAIILACMATGAGSAHAVEPGELPTGGYVTNGQANISQTSSTMTIDQQTDKMTAEWDTFNIGQDASVEFRQPGTSSVALNRIYDQNPSQIFGRLSSNGQVFLLNPSGVYFGPTAQVDVGGMVASSLKISDEDFLKEKYNFESSGDAGTIINDGNIRALNGGYLAFIAPEIKNSGIISADKGSALFAAGDRVNLDFTGDGLVTFTVDQGAIDAQIENKGLIQTTDGMVMMTAKAADDLIGSVINNTGIIEAKGVTEQGGRILLFADGGQSTISGALDASSDAGAGGNVTVTGDRVLVESGAHLTASGATGGGDVLVGGNWQGSDPTIHQAEGAVIEQGALLEANATDKGDGGTVVAWSDVQNPNSVTRAYGTFEAKGGPNGGNGGRIETSGHWMDVGMAPDMSAPAGNGGLWLIDPYNITVVAGSGNTNINAGSPFLSSGDSASLGVELVNTALGSGNVTIQTGSGGTQAGDITWNTAYTYVGGTARSLTLQAHRDILLNYSIESTGGALGMTFTANSDGLGSGGTVVKGDLTTNGGDLTFNGTGAIFSGSSAQTLSTSNGAINFNGETIIANTNGLTLNSGNGNIVFASRIDSGNTYIYDNTARTWNNAYTAAGGAGSGVTGSTYLATVTSALEMSSVMAAAGGSQAWLGGSDAATEGVWRWVTGPEGLESEAGGTGRIFWTTSQATGATGYNGYNSRYVNWNTGEPNDSGSNEDALQLGAGLTGQWNDLPNASSTLGSIVETNLAASPLTINSGTVTFDGAVGSNKALSSLTVTAATTAINGGAVTTEGVQTYNTDMTVGSASTTLTQINSYTDFTIQNGYTLSNAHSSSATVTMNTTRDINVNGIISSSTNPLNMVFNADSERNDDGAIIISKDIATHGGYIKFGGDSSYEVGTVLSGSVTRSISTSGGAVDFYGDVMAVVDTDITTAGGNVTFHNKLDAGNSYTLSGTSTFNWSQAVDDADNVANSYLITITSALENSLARSVANGNDVWTGAYRGADNYWRWMTGPEALLEGGDGLAFSIGASSASSVPGTYSNWTSDEPNASGLAMQIWYNGGVAKWDDTGATTAKYYIRETAGDAAVFSVDAGAGAVTFTGSVGETSALGSLSVTSTAVSDGINIDGGTVTTEGVQAYTGSVTLGAMATTLTQTDADTNFTLTTGTSITNDFGNDASLTIKTTGSIIMDPNSSISSSTGKLDAVLWSDTDANGGGVWMKPGSSISSNSGNVTVAGGLDDGSNGGSSADGIPDGFSTGRDGVANHTDGIWFQNATINSGGGDVTIRGKGATTGNVNNTLGFQSNMGVLGASSSGDAFNLNSGSGKINIHGVSRETNGINAQGISWISGKITSANTASDAITIVGDASLTNNTGWAMGADLRGTIQTTASGGISITGIGGTTTGALSTQAHGLVLWGSGNVLSNSGAITLTGTVGSTINSSVDIYQPGYLGYKSGTDVIASSSNIRLNANTMTLAGTDRLQSSGTLTIQPRTANTTIGIAGGAGTLSLPASYFTTNFSDGFSSITIGSATAGAITVGAATTFNDNVTLLNNSTIVINGAVTANENLTLTSNGAITQSAALDVTGTTNITAGEANEITLSNTSNDFTGAVSVVSGNDIDIVDSNTMTLGAVNSTGTVDVATLTGDLTLTGAIETTDTTDTAIVLNAGKNTAAGTSTGGNIIVSGGSVTTGAGGRASLYSGDVSDSAGLTALIGSGSGKFRYNSDESASNFTTTLSAGKYAIYRAQPIITVTPSSGQSVTYGSGPGSVYSLSGYLNGDSSTSTSGAVTWTVSGTTSTAGYITAGIHDISYNTGLTNSLGYGFADNAGSADELTVTQRSITVTGLTVSDKTYDSTNTASLGGTAAISVLGADVVTLGGTPAGTFADKNVGTGKAVTVTGNTISGTDSGNYTLAQQTGLTADITQRAISISGIIAANKVYDATTSATVDTTGAAGWLAGDTVTVSASGLFDNKNVGTGKTVTLTSSYGGADLGNYSITDQASTTANITQRAINISGITAANKDYNANTTATVDTTGAAGWLAGDTVTVSASGLFDNKNVGTGKTVDLTSSYSGADADNYSITDQATTNANITQRAITISGITAANKVYDANTTATVDTTGAEGWLTGDTVTVSASGLFDNKNVGTGKTVTLTSSYAGDDASNYSITDQVTTTANITQRPITISGITAANKVYDANTTATLDTTGAAGWLAGDTVTVSASGLFDNKNVGTGKT